MKKKLLICLSVILVLCVGLFAACQNGGRTTLAKPEISISENVVSWSAIENAASYDVYVNGTVKDNVTETLYTVTETEIGSYIIKVKAISGNSEKYNNSDFSNSVEYEVEGAVKLAKPTLAVIDNLIAWDAVANAASYEVYVDGQLKDTVTEPGYEMSGFAIGEYSVTVIAKSANTELYLDSDASDAVTYNSVKEFIRMEKISDPDVTEYYLDENKELDLTGLEVIGVFANVENEAIVLTENNIVSDYDMKKAGRYELDFEYVGENGVKSTITVRINVKERTKNDVEDYLVMRNEYTESKYKILDSAVETAVTMDGKILDVVVDNGATFVSAEQLSEGEHLLKVDDIFVNVIVARLVKTVEDFNKIIDALDGYYLLCNDLDFSEETCVPIGRAPVAVNAKLDLTGSLGVAFNGTFNGDGYVIKNFSYAGVSNEAWYEPEAYGLGLFGYVGEEGKICNLVLRNVSISGGAYCSFVAGCNLGVIENVMVEENCELFNAFGEGAVVSAYNYGTVKNVVSYVEKYKWNYGDDLSMDVVNKEDSYSSDSGVNGYVGDSSDLTAVLGKGWEYINGYGTVFGNDNYKKILSADTIWYADEEIKISFWQMTNEEVYFAVWGTGASDPTTVLTYLSYDSETYTYTLKVTNGVTLTVGSELAVGVGIVGKGYVELFDVTVGEIETTSDGVVYEKLNVSVSNNVLEYSASSPLDIKSVCTFTFEGEAIDSSAVTVETVACGNRSVKFTYVSDEVTYGVKYDFEIWYIITTASEWAMMNTYLDGNFKLGGDIDLEGATYSAVIGKAPLINASNGDEGYEIDQTGNGDQGVQAGVAFTGNFDGANYTVKGFVSDYGEVPYDKGAYALVPFAYVGVGGKVSNFTLSGASIRCGQSGSFLVGLNLGTVSNVIIAENCTLYVHYSTNTPYLAVINGGTISNVTCNVNTFENNINGTSEITSAVYLTVGEGKEENCVLS